VRSQIALFTPYYILYVGHDDKLTQNAHVFEHGCSYAVKHKEVRERPTVHSAFSLIHALLFNFSLSVW